MKITSLIFGERLNFSFTTRLSPEECFEQLRAGFAKKRSNVWGDYTSDITGTIDKPKFKLIKITLPLYRNSWNPIYYGKVCLENGSTIISGHFDTPFVVKIFTVLLLIFISFWEGSVLIAGLFGMWTDSLFWWIIFFLAGAFILGVLVSMVKIGTTVGRDARNRIVNFINTTLHATPNQFDLDALMAA